MIYNSWKKYKLHEVCNVYDSLHQTPPYVQTGYPMVRVTDVKQGVLDISTCFRVSKDTFNQFTKKYTPKKGDIIISRVGSYGNFSYVNTNTHFCLGQNTAVISPAHIEHRFAYYLLISPFIKEQIETKVSGSTQKTISLKSIKEITFGVPSHTEQKAIAAVLSALDDKIELNNRINKNLEAQAQTIFESWFVDFQPFQDGEFVESELGLIPKGWRAGHFADIAKITMGQSPKGDSYNEDGIGTVFYQGRAEFGMRFPTRRLFTTEPKRMADKNDILLSVRAPVGDYNIATENCCIGRGLAAINPHLKTYAYCLCLMNALQPQFNQFNGEGTVFGSINKDSLNGMCILIPSEIALLKFEEIISPINKLVLNNFKSNRTLAALRDTLLPKLMSGEIRVPLEV